MTDFYTAAGPNGVLVDITLTIDADGDPQFGIVRVTDEEYVDIPFPKDLLVVGVTEDGVAEFAVFTEDDEGLFVGPTALDEDEVAALLEAAAA